MPTKSEITYSHEWIYRLENKLHWKLYWHQLDLILNKSSLTKEQDIVEVGIGSGLLSAYLRQKGYHITTVDIDKNKKPDVVANILEDEIPGADVYLAFEILEHVPFNGVQNFLEKLQKMQVRQLIFSVPHAYRTYLFCEFWLPYIGDKTIHIGRKRNHINTENHHWEIGIKGITNKKIENVFKDYGYKIEYDFRYRNHHFYIANLIMG